MLPFNLRYVVYTFLIDFFASPVPILIVIIAKIFFRKLFSNKVFWITLVITFILTVYGSYKDSHEVMYLITPFYQLTPSEAFFRDYSDFILDACISTISCCILLLPIMFVGVIGYFIKTKDKTVLKKFIVSSLLLAPFIYVSYPCHKFGLFGLSVVPDDTNKIIEKYKYIENKTVLPPVRAVMAREVANFTRLNDSFIYSRMGEEYFKSDEFKKTADDFAKYTIIMGNYMGYSEQDLYNLVYYEKFDELMKIIDKLEKRTNKVQPMRIDVYIAKKDYQKAFEIAENTAYQDDRTKYFYYTIIYTGLNQFDKANEALNNYKNSSAKNGDGWYKKTKIYLDYKQGNIEKAKAEYEKEYEYNLHKDFDAFIKRIERIEY